MLQNQLKCCFSEMPKKVTEFQCRCHVHTSNRRRLSGRSRVVEQLLIGRQEQSEWRNPAAYLSLPMTSLHASARLGYLKTNCTGSVRHQYLLGLNDPVDWHLLGNTESDDDDLEENGSSPFRTTDGADEVDMATWRRLSSAHDMYSLQSSQVKLCNEWKEYVTYSSSHTCGTSTQKVLLAIV